MRAYVVLLTSVVFSFASLTSCGGDQFSETGGAAGASGGGGSSTGGSSTAGSSTGGSSTAGSSTGGSGGVDPSWRACDKSTDCLLVEKDCCGVCGEPRLSDLDAINKKSAGAYNKAKCTPPPEGCPGCASAPKSPALVAVCVNKQCEKRDLRGETQSDCDSDQDCVLRYEGCCPSCASAPEKLLAVNHDGSEWYQNEFCSPNQACDACQPQFPEKKGVVCGSSDHCEIVDNEKVCPYQPPPADTSCSMGSLVICDYDDNPIPTCRESFRCASNKWKAIQPDSDCGSIPSCSSDAQGQTCTDDGGVCVKSDGRVCGCVDKSGGGMNGLRWFCAPDPKDPCPPVSAPMVGSACSAESTRCEYGVCGTRSKVTVKCDHGAWRYAVSGCPKDQ